MTICALFTAWSVSFFTATFQPFALGVIVASSGNGALCHQSLRKSWLVHTGTKTSALKVSPFCRTVARSVAKLTLAWSTPSAFFSAFSLIAALRAKTLLQVLDVVEHLLPETACVTLSAILCAMRRR